MYRASTPTGACLALIACFLLTAFPTLRAENGGSPENDPAKAVPLVRTPSSSVYYLPQFVSGGVPPLYITTRISVTNLTPESTTAQLKFYADNGSELPVTFDCLQDSTLSGTVSSRIFTIGSKQSYTFVTPGTGPLTIGWARVGAYDPLLVTASYTVFRVEAAIGGQLLSQLGPPPLARDVPLWTASVTPAVYGTQLSLNPIVGPDCVMNQIGDEASIAIANPSEQDITVHAKLFTAAGGDPIKQKLIPLKAKGHMAAYLTEIFGAIPLVDAMQTTVTLASNTNFTAMALQRQVGNGADLNGATTVALDSSSTRTVLYDTEPNDNHDGAQKISTPAEIYGTQCDAAGTADRDVYSVTLSQNQTVSVTLLGESVGSKVNPVLWLEDGSGTKVADGEELFPGGRDRSLSYSTPLGSTATFYIYIGTLSGSYGRDSFYRMHVIVK